MSDSAHGDMASYRIAFTDDGRAHMDAAGGPVRVDTLYRVGDDVIARAFGARLPQELADLIDVALAVYVADRLSRRRPPGADRYQLHWGRRFELRLPVRDPDRWRDAALGGRLREALALFTEDDWRFDFVPRSSHRRAAETQEFLFPTQPSAPGTVALFSGGLDSLAGLGSELLGRARDSFVLVCGGTNLRTMGVQRELAQALRLRLGRDITPLIVPFGLRQRGGRQYDGDERTQRSRGFVFQALGAVVAIMAGADSLAVYEHGVGAINLPYTAAQLGAQSTRAAHPLALSAMGDFIALATGRRLVFRLPAHFVTKGQLCGSLPELGLADLIGRTVSCDGFPQRVAGRPQCGLCTSCLLRRQALHAAGLAEHDAPGGYVHDVLDPALQLPPAKLYPLRAMLDQVGALRRALDRPEPWRALSRAYPQLVEIAASAATAIESPAAVEARLVGLYRRYCAEWDDFPVRLSARTMSPAA